MIGISEELTVIRPGGALSPRCAGVLEAALAGRQAEVLSRLEGPLTGRRLLFVVSLDEGGVNRGFYDLLAHLRTHPNCLDRCVGSVLVDAPGDLYTKAAGRDLVLAANLAGCAFVGRPLVEGTGDLRNFTVQARNAGCSLEAAYHLATADLVERVLAFSRPRLERPKLLALHASSRATSNTLALWGLVRTRLEERCDITEICLRNGTLEAEDDILFHGQILQATHNSFMISLGNALNELFRRSIAIAIRDNPEVALHDHESIYQAIVNRDPVAAEKVIAASARQWAASFKIQDAVAESTL